MPMHQPLDADSLGVAEHTATLEQRIGVPSSDVFESLAGVEDWPLWVGLEVEYTSPAPHGVGSTRTVWPRKAPHVGVLGVREVFTAWKPDEELAFYLESSPFPVSRFAERFLIRELSGGDCVLRWTIGVEGRLGSGIVPAMKTLGRMRLPSLAQRLEAGSMPSQAGLARPSAG